MNFEDLRKFAPQLINIAQKYSISKIYVFGSIARGDNTPRSDVDFLVDMQEGFLFLVWVVLLMRRKDC